MPSDLYERASQLGRQHAAMRNLKLFVLSPYCGYYPTPLSTVIFVYYPRHAAYPDELALDDVATLVAFTFGGGMYFYNQGSRNLVSLSVEPRTIILPITAC